MLCPECHDGRQGDYPGRAKIDLAVAGRGRAVVPEVVLHDEGSDDGKDGPEDRAGVLDCGPQAPCFEGHRSSGRFGPLITLPLLFQDSKPAHTIAITAGTCDWHCLKLPSTDPASAREQEGEGEQ